ncbi:Rna exonuclease [Thalictrum thalictroides]|uniref:Rna exonuclease n=1 Tax=Thalictrum thalictroides TaxID=46969 RepID=A0A7J6X6R6_THATH|nr:Rna exonuclease [Thalictrum thalictroides]
MDTTRPAKDKAKYVDSPLLPLQRSMGGSGESQDLHEKTWLNLFQKTKSFDITSLISFTTAVKEGLVEVPDEIIQKGIAEWEKLLLGVFIGKKLPFTMVRNALLNALRLNGVVEITADKDLFYFNFNEPADKQKVIDGGPVFIAGRIFMIQPWSEKIEEQRHGIKTIPIWIKLFDVPKSLWTREGLSFIASMVGEPICMDDQTASISRLNFARICVEVPVNHEYKKVVNFSMKEKSVDISIEYPWIPKSCTKCNKFGHSHQGCDTFPIKSKGTRSWKERARNQTWKKKYAMKEIGQTSEERSADGIPLAQEPPFFPA